MNALCLACILGLIIALALLRHRLTSHQKVCVKGMPMSASSYQRLLASGQSTENAAYVILPYEQPYQRLMTDYTGSSQYQSMHNSASAESSLRRSQGGSRADSVIYHNLIPDSREGSIGPVSGEDGPENALPASRSGPVGPTPTICVEQAQSGTPSPTDSAIWTASNPGSSRSGSGSYGSHVPNNTSQRRSDLTGSGDGPAEYDNRAAGQPTRQPLLIIPEQHSSGNLADNIRNSYLSLQATPKMSQRNSYIESDSSADGNVLALVKRLENNSKGLALLSAQLSIPFENKTEQDNRDSTASAEESDKL